MSGARCIPKVRSTCGISTIYGCRMRIIYTYHQLPIYIYYRYYRWLQIVVVSGLSYSVVDNKGWVQKLRICCFFPGGQPSNIWIDYDRLSIPESWRATHLTLTGEAAINLPKPGWCGCSMHGTMHSGKFMAVFTIIHWDVGKFRSLMGWWQQIGFNFGFRLDKGETTKCQ